MICLALSGSGRQILQLQNPRVEFNDKSAEGSADDIRSQTDRRTGFHVRRSVLLSKERLTPSTAETRD